MTTLESEISRVTNELQLTHDQVQDLVKSNDQKTQILTSKDEYIEQLKQQLSQKSPPAKSRKSVASSLRHSKDSKIY